jgi:hypothetical protein
MSSEIFEHLGQRFRVHEHVIRIMHQPGYEDNEADYYLVSHERDLDINPDLEEHEHFKNADERMQKMLRAMNRGHPLTFEREKIDGLAAARERARELALLHECEIEEKVNFSFMLWMMRDICYGCVHECKKANQTQCMGYDLREGTF